MFPLTILEPIEYLVVGHISCDLTPDGPKMGGTASYAALTAKALGLNVGVVTSWGCEIPLGPMANVIIHNYLAAPSTSFENIYTQEGRIQVIHEVARPLDSNSIPDAWLNTPIIHLGPIAGEVSPQVVTRFDHSFIGITPQGWLRTWDEGGRIQPTKWCDAAKVLRASSAVIISVEDVAGDEGIIEEMAAACPIFVVTEGFYGGRVYWLGDVRRFKAPAVKEVDATGAGDIFAAAFFIQYQKTGNPWEAARFANLLAAQSVTRSGLSGVPTNKDVKNAIIEVF